MSRTRLNEKQLDTLDYDIEQEIEATDILPRMNSWGSKRIYP